LMENVPDAPEPNIPKYTAKSILLNNRWVGGVSNRLRRFTFGAECLCDGPCGCAWSVDLNKHLETEALEPAEWLPTALACGGVKPGTEHNRGRRPGREYGYCTNVTLKTHLKSQGLPEGWLDHAPFTIDGKHKVLGNGVPLPMGRAIAKAVRQALRIR
jgi:DNA (cytosine-5)-methyltransferase 1